MDIFSSIPIFTSVVEQGSFSEAARRLGINKSAVSKRISALENHLGVKLIQRTTRRLHLTEAGQQYYDYVSQAQHMITQAEDAIASLQGAPRGQLKISLPMVFGQQHIAPLLSEFVVRYPEIKLDVSLDDKVVDLLEAGLDMVIRVGALPDSSLVAVKLSKCRSILCASPQYLARHGVSEDIRDLKEHNCLFYSYFRSGVEWSLDGPEGPVRIKPTGNIQVNNSAVIKRLLLDDLGIAQMPRFLVEQELHKGLLIPILTQYKLPDHGIYALYSQRTHMPAKLRVFIDYLKEKLATVSEHW